MSGTVDRRGSCILSSSRSSRSPVFNATHCILGTGILDTHVAVISKLVPSWVERHTDVG